MATKRKPGAPLPPDQAHRKAAREATAKAIEGRPPKYKTAADFLAKAAEYFRFADARMKCVSVDEVTGEAKMANVPAPYTIESLLDFCDLHLDTINGYEHGERGREFAEAVKDCKRKIRANWSERCNESRNPAGTIFYGKAALGYRDVQVVETSGPDGKPIEQRHTVIVVEDSPATGGHDPTGE